MPSSPSSDHQAQSGVSEPMPIRQYPLSFDQLREANVARAKQWRSSDKPMSVEFAVVELVGEVGELCNNVKKMVRANEGMAGGKIDMANLRDELADVVICCDLLGIRLDIDLAGAVIEKFNATSRKHGFSVTIPASSSPSKQEDDREWRSRCTIYRAERECAPGETHNVDSPSGAFWLSKDGDRLYWAPHNDPVYREYGAFSESDCRTHLAKAPPPPDSKPPTQSEDKAEACRCSCGRAGCTYDDNHGNWPTFGTKACSVISCGCNKPSPTKPTQSVQPWPEDLSVLVGRTITTRNKCDAPTATRTDVVYRIVDGWIFIDPKGSRQLHIPERDLLSVSPPLSQPQSGQSEGKVRWFRTKINVYKYDGRKMVSYRHTNPTDILDPDPNTLEQVMRDAEEFFPTQPKDSKELGPEWFPPLMFQFTTHDVGVAHAVKNRDAQWRSSLKSANERAERAEKKIDDIILWSGCKDACTCKNMREIRKIVGNIS